MGGKIAFPNPVFAEETTGGGEYFHPFGRYIFLVVRFVFRNHPFFGSMHSRLCWFFLGSHALFEKKVDAKIFLLTFFSEVFLMNLFPKKGKVVGSFGKDPDRAG